MGLYLIDNEHDYLSWDKIFYSIDTSYKTMCH